MQISRRWTNCHRLFLICMLVFGEVTFGGQVALAEKVENYSGCDVCHGAIHFLPDQTESLVSQKVLNSFARIRGNPVRKVDLDGVLQPGSAKSPDTGYELRIWKNSNSFFVKDLRDSSLIQLVVLTGQNEVECHLYLESSEENTIDLSDPLEIAWAKMRLSNIYQWIGKTRSKAKWLSFIDKQLYHAISGLPKR